MPERADDLQQMSGDRHVEKIDRIVAQLGEPPCACKEGAEKEQRTINELPPPHCVLSVSEPRDKRTDQEHRSHTEGYHHLP